VLKKDELMKHKPMAVIVLMYNVLSAALGFINMFLPSGSNYVQ